MATLLCTTVGPFDEQIKRLKQLKQASRILHLSTHGFYHAKVEKSGLADEAPLLLSGLVLAADTDKQKGEDGLLYSIEVLGLDLQGTQLVSLSACDTGKGVVDYSEGVYGLVRAGAENVLMTLTPVGAIRPHGSSWRPFMTTGSAQRKTSARPGSCIRPGWILSVMRTRLVVIRRSGRPMSWWGDKLPVSKETIRRRVALNKKY